MHAKPVDEIAQEAIDDLIDRAFAEDIKTGDVTTNAIINESDRSKAVWKTKDKGVVAGLGIAKWYLKS